MGFIKHIRAHIKKVCLTLTYNSFLDLLINNVRLENEGKR